MPSPRPPGRCWSGPSLRSLGVAVDREQSPASPRQQSDDGVESGGGDDDDGSEVAGDVVAVPGATHRGYGSLQKIYPHRTSQDFDRLRLFDGAVDIFLECVAGTRDQTRMNSQTFRSFVRSVFCHFHCLDTCRIAAGE